MRSGPACLVPVVLMLAGCEDGGPPAPKSGICLYDKGSCSYGALGGSCPPRPDEYRTVCVDVPGDECPRTGSDVRVDAAQGQAYADYYLNHREVEGISCGDWRADPGLDPEPLRTSCETEEDGVCDAPKRCPDGTDLVDCAGKPCPAAEPDDYECDRYAEGLPWCTNLEGGSRCAEEGLLYLCDGDVWVGANVVDIDTVCNSIGSSGYYGCSGAYDEFIAYCR